MKSSQGFTLLELMIVVAVAATIAALAIPSLLNARKNSVEASVIGRLRTLSTSSEQYSLRFGRYADSYASLQSSGMFDAGGFFATAGGYTLVYSGGTVAWTCNADPQQPGVSGDRYFYVDQTGVIRFETSGVAGSTSRPLD